MRTRTFDLVGPNVTPYYVVAHSEPEHFGIVYNFVVKKGEDFYKKAQQTVAKMKKQMGLKGKFHIDEVVEATEMRWSFI